MLLLQWACMDCSADGIYAAAASSGLAALIYEDITDHPSSGNDYRSCIHTNDDNTFVYSVNSQILSPTIPPLEVSGIKDRHHDELQLDIDDKNRTRYYMNDRATNENCKMIDKSEMGEGMQAPVVGSTVRVSSLLQKANGKAVEISDEAIRKSADFVRSVHSDHAPALLTAKIDPAIMQAPLRVGYDASSSCRSFRKRLVCEMSPLPIVGAMRTPSVDRRAATRRRCYASRGGYIISTKRPSMNIAEALNSRVETAAVVPSRMELLSSIHSGNALQRIAFDGRGGFVLSDQPEGSISSSSILFDAVCAALLHQSIAITAPPPPQPGDHRWLQMQIRWVAWTLVAYERKYPSLYLGQLLTERCVVECVLWRYRTYKSLLADPMEVEASSAVVVDDDASQKRKTYSSSSSLTAARRALSKPTHKLNLVTPNHPAAPADDSCGTITSRWKPPPSLGSVRSAGLVTPMGSHRSAQHHFRRRGAMSPLQRCCDIMCLLWPIVLCVSSSCSSSTSGTGVLEEGDLSKGMLIELSDGWWWASAVLDEELSRLLRKVRTVPPLWWVVDDDDDETRKVVLTRDFPCNVAVAGDAQGWLQSRRLQCLLRQPTTAWQ